MNSELTFHFTADSLPGLITDDAVVKYDKEFEEKHLAFPSRVFSPSPAYRKGKPPTQVLLRLRGIALPIYSTLAKAENCHLSISCFAQYGNNSFGNQAV